MAFRERLTALRMEKHWSQNALAKAAGVPQAVVQRLEAGERGVDHLTVSVASRLARALGVSIDYLVGQDAELRERARADTATVA